MRLHLVHASDGTTDSGQVAARPVAGGEGGRHGPQRALPPTLRRGPRGFARGRRLDGGTSPADALQALRSLDVTEQGLQAMAQDLVRIWQAPSAEGEPDPARVFVQKHGHLIALPARLDADTTMALARVLAPYVQAAA